MAFSNLALIGTSLTPAGGERRLPIKRPTTATIPLQVKSERRHTPSGVKSFAVSRRDVLRHLCSDALMGVALLLTKPAEARTGRLENKKKAMEKLREKAGASKSRTENKKPEPSPDLKISPFPVPRLEAPIGPLVEASLHDLTPLDDLL